MKTIKIICLLIFSSALVSAQEEYPETGNDTHETLFSKARIIGGFGAPIVTFSKIEDKITTSVGGGGGLIIDNFFIGLYGTGSTRIGDWRNDEIRIVKEIANLAHGGLWLGYTTNQNKLIHLFSSVKFGPGAVVYTEQYGSDPWDANIEDADQIFAVAPEIGVEINIFRFFKLAFTGGYRWVSGLNTDDTRRNYSDSDFNSPTGSITFRFGGFGRSKKIKIH